MFSVLVLVTLVTAVVGQSNLCAAPNGDFPNPSSEQCTTYFRCIQGTPILLRCPGNQRFEFLFRVCRPQAEVDCNRQLEVFAAPTVVQGLGGLGGLANLGGLAGAGLGGLGGGIAGGVAGGIAGGLGGGLGGVGALGGGGLAGGGLINLLSQLDGGDGDGNNGNNGLATVLALSAILNQRNGASPPQGAFGQLQLAPAIPAQNTQWQQPQTFSNPSNGHLAGQGTPFTTDDGRTFVIYPQLANLQLAPGRAQGSALLGGAEGTVLSNNINSAPNVGQGLGRGPGQWRRKHRQLKSGRLEVGQSVDENQSFVGQPPNSFSNSDLGVAGNKTNTTSVEFML
ncbi:hypothetical protein Bpfe_006900 [Biomphalaria pfeifferi]|uniref:Chitin-binding type-2 domain-containing protein n=1 Tax=Biomphalaria pfeifferi TaxID=112525 RepID=A0AAD8BZJ0_BIOPF|nr:hypothetical protein Bpfe_006900 [Biomphalaria pfeifferi]